MIDNYDIIELTLISGSLRQMQDMARRIAKVSREAKLEIEEDSYVEKFKPKIEDSFADKDDGIEHIIQYLDAKYGVSPHSFP